MNFHPNHEYIPNITNGERNALKELKRSNELIIKKADKSNEAVLWKREEYLDEAYRQLNSPAYEPSSEIEFKSINSKIDNLIDTFISMKFISICEANKLRNTTSNPGSFYMLAKIHKNISPCPGRPIISNINIPTEKLSHFVDELLKPLTKNMPSYIMNSYDFCEKIETLKSNIAQTDIICTFDITSLYTSIPHDKGLQAIDLLMSEANWSSTKCKFILEALHVILENNIFRFEGKLFRQIVGTAMGTPVAPSYATLYVAWYERQLIENCQNKPLVWLRYLDDIFSVWKGNITEINDFIQQINEFGPLKFTSNIQTPANFLDMTIYRDINGILRTTLYQKPESKRVYLHAKSNHPMFIKHNLIMNEATRILRLCSEKAEKTKWLKQLKQDLEKRGYTNREIYQNFKKAHNKNNPLTVKDKNRKKNDIQIYIPYHPAIRNLQKEIMHDINIQRAKLGRANLSIRIIHKSTNTIKKTLVRNKLEKNIGQLVKKNECTKCNRRNTKCCIQIKETNKVISSTTGLKYNIRKSTNCASKGIIYAATCSICGVQYVGESGLSMNVRLNNRRSDLNKRLIHRDAVVNHCVTEHDNEKRDVFDYVVIDSDLNESEHRKKQEQRWIGQLMTDQGKGINIDHCYNWRLIEDNT